MLIIIFMNNKFSGCWEPDETKSVIETVVPIRETRDYLNIFECTRSKRILREINTHRNERINQVCDKVKAV